MKKQLRKIEREAKIFYNIVYKNSKFFLDGDVTEIQMENNLEENLRVYFRRLKRILKGGKENGK